MTKGSPATQISKAAGGYDLVVVGNKGMTGSRRYIQRVVPSRVAHEAASDVLIVKTVSRSFFDLRPGEGAVVEVDGGQGGGLSPRRRDHLHAFGSLPAHGLHRRVEWPGPDLGLPLPRFPLRIHRRDHQRAEPPNHCPRSRCRGRPPRPICDEASGYLPLPQNPDSPIRGDPNGPDPAAPRSRRNNTIGT